MIVKMDKEIEKALTNIELVEDIEELKEAINSLTRVLIEKIKENGWDNCPYLAPYPPHR